MFPTGKAKEIKNNWNLTCVLLLLAACCCCWTAWLVCVATGLQIGRSGQDPPSDPFFPVPWHSHLSISHACRQGGRRGRSAAMRPRQARAVQRGGPVVVVWREIPRCRFAEPWHDDPMFGQADSSSRLAALQAFGHGRLGVQRVWLNTNTCACACRNGLVWSWRAVEPSISSICSVQHSTS